VKCSPTVSGMGTDTISSKVRVDATNVTHSGRATMITPAMSTACAKKSRIGLFSTMSSPAGPLPGRP
jgi:hypothetical protein